MNSLQDSNYINRLCDEIEQSRNILMNEMRNDTECTKEAILTKKIACADAVLKNLIKYRNISTKEKLKADL